MATEVSASNAGNAPPRRIWHRQASWRVPLAALAALLCAGAWRLNADNTFTGAGVACWLGGVAAWAAALLPGLPARLRAGWRLPRGADTRSRGIVVPWNVAALVAIVAAGAALRFYDLDAYPPEMTSDHVEKILDALRIAGGSRPVFLMGNGGREGAQFYLLALAHAATGRPFDFAMLKALTAIEGTIGIVAVWWLARVAVGEERGTLGDLTGLVAAGLVAISHWHLMLSHLGLRIVLTPLVSATLLAFLVRGLRHGRRADFLAAGLTLGVGFYCYQAVRMAPVLVACAGVVAILRHRRERAVAAAFLHHFAALAVLAGAVAIPLARFAAQYPQYFWLRTSTRLLGDGTVIEPGLVGGATLLRALPVALAKLGGGIWTALLMLNVRGDGSWFNGTANGAPALDRFTGALFLAGILAWGWPLIRGRDPARWLIPLGIPIMLLPTALAFAFPGEVPSATRASGALPFVFVLAAYPVALALRIVLARLTGLPDRLLTFGLLGLLAIPLTQANASLYFGVGMSTYRATAPGYKQPGAILGAFVAETGAPGNAFVLDYPHWWDHRAVAIESGDPRWDNGVRSDEPRAALTEKIASNVSTRYAFRPDRPVQIFLNQHDEARAETLRGWFAGATVRRVVTGRPDHDFLLLTAPPVGCAWLNATLGTATSPQCP